MPASPADAGGVAEASIVAGALGTASLGAAPLLRSTASSTATGSCFSTVIVFILLWWLLGHFGIFK